MDKELAYNAVELVLESPDLLPDVFIHEVGRSDVVVLFATTSTAYRLILPHPTRIHKVCMSIATLCASLCTMSIATQCATPPAHSHMVCVSP